MIESGETNVVNAYSFPETITFEQYKELCRPNETNAVQKVVQFEIYSPPPPAKVTPTAVTPRLRRASGALARMRSESEQRERRRTELAQMTVDQLRRLLAESEKNQVTCQARSTEMWKRFNEVELRFRQATGSDRDKLAPEYERAKADNEEAGKEWITWNDKTPEIEREYLLALKRQKDGAQPPSSSLRR